MKPIELARILRDAIHHDDVPQYHVHLSATHRTVKVCLRPRPEQRGVARAWFDALDRHVPRDWRVEVVADLGDPVTRTLSYLRHAGPVQDDGNPPNGCRWCGVEKYDHIGLYKIGVGWHPWENPGDELRKARMLGRRAGATATA